MKTKISKNKTFTEAEKSDFPIVGIGASAGGLEALEKFFGNIPKDTGMAFVVIQHLDPKRSGFMPELLQRMTTMKVLQASDRLKVKPNCVYVIPPNKSMSLLNGALFLFAPVESRGLRLPIDIFFCSLAEDMQNKSIGIILSGMGSDGRQGIKAIKEKNGIVLIQDPASAKFDSMPRSANLAVVADIVALAEDLPNKLIELLKFIPTVMTGSEIESKTISNLDKIIILLQEQSGHDFSLYKKNTLFRRIERRKGIHQIDTIQNYFHFLQENPKEVELLFKELLIGVTSFFRDTAVWEILKNKIIPDLIYEMPDGHLLRAWVTACSTGEEAYSLAMVFKEAIEKVRKHKRIQLQIFATDLDRAAIDKARKGLFPKKITEDVSPERLSRFFTADSEGFRVNNDIREMVVFAPQNIIKDPPFTKLDILSCRNMLIYMEPVLQKKLIQLFQYSLKPGGILLLGTSESLGTQNEGFNDLDTKLKIYKRSDTIIASELKDFPISLLRIKKETTINKIIPASCENIQTLADEILLQRFAPASVLVNEKGDVIYITGHTWKYLEPVTGKTNWNIYTMAREGFKNELPEVFELALQNYDKIILHDIKIEINWIAHFVDVTVQRIENPGLLNGLILFVFSDVLTVVESDLINQKTGKKNSTLKQKELEIKLKRSNEEIQSLSEEMLTSQEELNSSNEELQSTNEELQSSNEEMQSTNEELIFANKELAFQHKEKEKRAEELVVANKELAYQNEEKEKRAAELIIANNELAYQNREREKRADELIIANKELAYQNEEKEKRANELVIANKKLAYQNEEKEKRANELVIANKELAYQNREKEKRADELILANKELAYQNEEKEKRAKELILANKELAFQNEEKEKRAKELVIANKELAYQNREKEKRADELILANKELIYQSEEKEKRAAELLIALERGK